MNWGNIPSYYNNFVTNLKHLKQNHPMSDEKLQVLKEESKQHESALDFFGPVVPGTMFIFPQKDLLLNEKLQLWFPSIVEGHNFLELCPEILPFDKNEYVTSCNIIPQLENNVGLESLEKLLDIAKIADYVSDNPSTSPQAISNQKQVDTFEAKQSTNPVDNQIDNSSIAKDNTAHKEIQVPNKEDELMSKQTTTSANNMKNISLSSNN